MHHDRPGPGKFEGNGSARLAEALYAVTLDGGCNDDLGEVDSFGWYGIIRRPHVGIGYIVSEDSRGFFSYDRMPLVEANVVWDGITREYAELDDVALD